MALALQLVSGLAALGFQAVSAPPPEAPSPTTAARAAPAAPGDCGEGAQGGAANISVEGERALRLADGTCVTVIEGASTVMFGGKPVAVVGARVRCPDGRIGVIEGGAASVMVEGRPVALSGARVSGCD